MENKCLKLSVVSVYFSVHDRFCVGDRFYLCDNKILCESDYEDRMMLQNGMAQAQAQSDMNAGTNHNSSISSNNNSSHNQNNNNNSNANMNNNLQESINHNLKSMHGNGKATKKYQNYMNRNNGGNGMMPPAYNAHDYINYDVRRPSLTDMSIGVR